MSLRITIAAALVALPGWALAQSTTAPAATAPGATGQGTSGHTIAAGESQSGTQFLQQVGKESVNEIREALIAEAQAHDPAVRAYARLMIEDHTILESQLSALSGSAGFNLSTIDQSGDEGTDLKGMSGPQFDRKFIDHEVTQHRQSVQRWERAEKDLQGNNTAGSFARLGLPLQQEHLALAEAIQARLQK